MRLETITRTTFMEAMIAHITATIGGSKINGSLGYCFDKDC